MASSAAAPFSESSDTALRRERAAIAAQACQTCHSRKSKCDERRPKCGLCRRLNVECLYREPLPTKKDKTMVHILDTLTRLENKFDNLALSGSAASSDTTPSASRASVSFSSSSLARAYRSEQEYSTQSFPLQLQHADSHLTVPHKIVLWPSIYIFLINSGVQATSDLQYVLQEGTPWFIRHEMASRQAVLPSDVGLTPYAVTGQPAASDAGSARIGFHTLSAARIQELSESYFNTFNILCPILNREKFTKETLEPILEHGFPDGHAETVLVLLMLALGQVAISGVFERPIGTIDGAPSGFRGGTVDRPPGLDMFNEARRRIGFIATHMTLETVQSMLLQATYFEATARHLDFWQSTVAASMACQVLIKCQTNDWQTHYGDLVKRAYWTCVLSEDLYHLDLDLPKSGIQQLQDLVPLPYFHEGGLDAGAASPEDRSHFQYHFLAMIALRRLISRIHDVVHESSATRAESSDDYGGPPVTVIREMARQLESWRSLLPRPLQWQDSDRFDFPNIDPAIRRPNEALFSPDQGPVPIGHKFNLDVVTAQLRTRFYYARFMMYRPFVYKALHFPELMTQEDRNCCALAIKSALMWPVTLAPTKNKKRLVPHLFAWTQNFLGILLVLRMTTDNECLKSICEEYIDPEEMQKTVTLLLEWMRDVKQVDGIADWSWSILGPLYSGG